LKKFLLKFFIPLFFAIFNEELKASCNFKTGNYIDELSIPNSIKGIDIELNNPRKYSINSLRILMSEKRNIEKKYKKKYRAKFRVNFDFGSCNYKAKIWQNGDWKDHIKLVNGGSNLINSLNVKLEDGNILNATKFKLLIPETRNDKNEILGTVILKNLGFITPETFEVNVNTNNYSSKMIFQEDSQKELLERNFRREGPIFEGDETILWSSGRSENKDGFKKDFEYLSLSRLINNKWFLKGESSQSITLTALHKLQEAYLERFSHENSSYIDPNNIKDDIFADYRFLLLSMDGLHGLTLHNMKFFYNSFENKFEPIYFDGDIKIIDQKNESILINNMEAISFDDKIYFSDDYIFPYIDFIQEEVFANNVKRDFKKRVLDFNNDSEELIKKAINNLIFNTKYIQRKIEEGKRIQAKSKLINKKDNRLIFLENNANLEAEKNIIKNFKIANQKVDLVMEDEKKFTTNLYTMSRMISRKEVDKERYLFLPTYQPNQFKEEIVDTIIPELNTVITHPKTAEIIFKKDLNSSKLIIVQKLPNQSIFINGGKLNDLLIVFKGEDNLSKENNNSQRFNERGLTGCLNIYNANLNNTSIEVDGGRCEDSLNIISSKGDLKNIVINNAFQDAIDLDFSDLQIDEILIKNAGNDCLDVSSGNYLISNANLKNCFDKAISVGEKSLFKSNDINISNSNIGVAVKDFSKFINKKITINNSPNCFQVFQKKQEFGGALLDLNEVHCIGNYQTDDNSTIYFR
tara:strand:+ start:5513 stop:7759 length:2247 start_codon:yes stop_codon:yes gene_type:complete